MTTVEHVIIGSHQLLSRQLTVTKGDSVLVLEKDTLGGSAKTDEITLPVSSI